MILLALFMASIAANFDHAESLASSSYGSVENSADYSIRLPVVPVTNSSSLDSTENERGQSLLLSPNGQLSPSYFTSLANMLNLGGSSSSTSSAVGSLRTIMMGGMLYGLSLLPAALMAFGGNNLFSSPLMASLGLNKRAMEDTSSASLPMLSESQTKRLLKMLQSAFRQWSIADDECKMLFVCQMYKQVSGDGVTPDLELFREALLHILERSTGKRHPGGTLRNILMAYEHYFDAARQGMDMEKCEERYPLCPLSLHSGKRKNPKKNKPSGKSGQSEDGNRKSE